LKHQNIMCFERKFRDNLPRILAVLRQNLTVNITLQLVSINKEIPSQLFT